MMLKEKYQRLLELDARKLDVLFGKESIFERLVKEITQNQDQRAVLEYLKYLGGQVRRNSTKEQKELEARSSELLFQYLGASHVEELIDSMKAEEQIALEDLLQRLEKLVGLKTVKREVQNLLAFQAIQHQREKSGLKKSTKTLHMAFLGNPGTAKTTVARLIGRMYRSMGILSKGHFIEASRTDLIAEYQGQTAIKVKRLIQRARGGVLFIDEAYSLTENDHSDSYGRESLTELTKALEDYRDDLVVIVAGYKGLMDAFFDANPGLKSRFSTMIDFEDYNLDELLAIFNCFCMENDYRLGPGVSEAVREVLGQELAEQPAYFANGRTVRNVFDQCVLRQSVRLYNLSNRNLDRQVLLTLEKEDVPIYIGKSGD